MCTGLTIRRGGGRGEIGFLFLTAIIAKRKKAKFRSSGKSNVVENCSKCMQKQRLLRGPALRMENKRYMAAQLFLAECETVSYSLFENSCPKNN